MEHCTALVTNDQLLTGVVIDEVGLALVGVRLLPVGRQGAEAVVVRGVGVAGVRVVLGDALPAAAACIVGGHTCNRGTIIRSFKSFLKITLISSF